MRDGKWEYTIRAWYPDNQKHKTPSDGRPYGLCSETTHANRASRDIEIQVLKNLMNRGDIACIDVIAHVEPYGTERMFADKYINS